MSSTSHSLIIFMQFFRRDLFAKRRSFLGNALNYAFIYPIVFAVQSAYLQAHTNFGTPSHELSTILFAGNIIVVVLIFTFKQNIVLLYDLENQRYIDYQITLLSPFWVLWERILFTGLYTFLITLPYYPMGALLLGNYINLGHTNWPQLVFLLFAGSLCLSAYHLLATVTLHSSANIVSLWNRVNGPLMLLGGFWIPLYVMQNYSKVLGTLVYLNPCLYLTEGLKRAITGSDHFLSFALCLSMLTFFTILFTGACWLQFRRRTDCL